MVLRGNKVLVTTVPVEAKGGIAALHKLFVERQPELNLRFFTIGSSTPFSERLSRRYLRLLRQYGEFAYTLFKDRNIGIVHINTAPDQQALMRDIILIYLAKLWKKKIVVQVHGTMRGYEVTQRIKKLTAKAFSLSNRILVFSRLDQTEIELAIGNGGKVITFPNAVKVNDFVNNNEDLRGKFSLPKENKVVLFLARLIKEKGIYDIFDAIPSIVKKFDKVTFIFAGEGPEKDRMRAECINKKLEKWVIIAGNLQYDDVIRAFKTADILVLPSYSEGMPMSLLQALASGVSIVATPVGAIPDFLQNGENGFLVQTNSHVEIAEKILILLQNDSLRQRMEFTNLELAKTEFDVDVVISKLGELYASL